MARPPIEIEYAKAFPELEKVLRGVTRPGEVFASGKENVALPLLTVEGAGQIAFPVPAAQAKQIAQAAPLAPFGRGTETVLDTSVRKVRQLLPKAVKISGKGWKTSLADIVNQKCKCEDCQELQAFAADPVAEVHRFRVNKDRRRHLHATIESRGLDMTHLTERVGSPQTLVCTKTRMRFALRSNQYATNLAAFKMLLSLARASGCSADPAVALMKQAGSQ